MTSVMLDLETWGTTPGSDIRSIGAVVFDPIAGTLGETFYQNVENPHVAGVDVKQNGFGFDDTSGVWRRFKLTRDPKTVQWWSEQSEEARAALTKDVVDLDEGLIGFGIWLNYVLMVHHGFAKPGFDPHTHLRIWAHGPTFDVSLLGHVYTVCGAPIPWHYRAPRDTRTILEAAGMDPVYGIPKNGTWHNALDDAKNQALAVIEAYGKLGLSTPNNESARAIIERDSIVIRVPIENLPVIVDGAWAAGGMDVRYRITDAPAFAEDLVCSLNAEQEDGTTAIHEMFDSRIEHAIDQGAQGVEEHPDQEP